MFEAGSPPSVAIATGETSSDISLVIDKAAAEDEAADAAEVISTGSFIDHTLISAASGEPGLLF